MKRQQLGRPKIKGTLRNFTFLQEVYNFLTDEAGRTGKTMTCYIEQALMVLKNKEPSIRDAEMQLAWTSLENASVKSSAGERVMEDPDNSTAPMPPLLEAPATRKPKQDPGVASGAKGLPPIRPDQNEMLQPKQIPGCLPEGYDLDSLLTLEQFAIWRQVSVSTVRNELPLTKGVIKWSREDVRIHPRTHLEAHVKRK